MADDSDNKAAPFLSLTLPFGAGKRDFETPEELATFLSLEDSIWVVFNGLPEQGNFLQIKAAYSRLHDVSHRMASRPEKQPDFDKWHQEIRNLAAQLYSQDQNCPYSESPEGKFVLRINRDMGSRTAATTLFSIGQRKPSEEQAGVMLAMIFRAGFDGAGHRDSAKGEFEQYRTLLEERKAAATALITEAEQIRDKFNADAEEIVKDRNLRFDQAEKRYNEIRTIDQPASYWRGQFQYHQRRVWAWGVATLCVAILGGLGLVKLYSHRHDVAQVAATQVAQDQAANSSINTDSPEPGADGKDAPVSQPTSSALTKAPQRNEWLAYWSQMFPVIIAAIGLFWLLRIMVRSYMSHVHLQSDAGERLVMANTFLALQEGRHALEPSDRAIVLSQLFRHAATGLVKDDAAPQTPASFFIKP